MQGRIKWFNTEKGYGFIQPDDGSKDVFVHINSIRKSGLTEVLEGQNVTFDLEVGRNGKNSAGNLKVV